MAQYPDNLPPKITVNEDGTKKVEPPLKPCGECGRLMKRTWARFYVCNECERRLIQRGLRKPKQKPQQSTEIPY